MFFTLGEVLSVITGKMLSRSGMSGIYEILNHMTGRSIYTHEIPEILKICSPILKIGYPDLAELNPEIKSEQELLEFLDEMSKIHGDIFRVPQIKKEDK